jgi:death on curing protein
MIYLSAAEIAAINEVVIEESGGSIGIRESGLLESIARKPATGFGDHESYPDIFLKAAVLYEAIVNYHVFIDGNKRTAFAATARFLNLNGYDLHVSDAEIEDYTISIATTKAELAGIATWIKKHSRKAEK